MTRRIFLVAILATLLLSCGCASDAHRDCWFEYSNPIDPAELIWTPGDPLIDLWFLPYSPCTFEGKPIVSRERE